MRYTLTLPLLTLALLVGCSKKAENAAPGAAGSVFDQPVADIALDGRPVTVAGLTFTPPASWIDRGPSGMRQADFAFGPLEGDSEPASVAVFYFGPDQGGDVESNINRWMGQMTPEGGVPVQEAAVRSRLEVDGMAVSTVELTGTYNAGMGGMMGGAAPKPGYRLVGAVIDGPRGLVFFKLTGPDKTAAAMSRGFVAMIRALKKAQGPEQSDT